MADYRNYVPTEDDEDYEYCNDNDDSESEEDEESEDEQEDWYIQQFENGNCALLYD